MQFTLSFLLLFLSITSLAQTSYIKNDFTNHTHYVLEANNQSFYVDELLEDKEGFLSRTKRHRFVSETEAKHFLNSRQAIKKNFAEMRPLGRLQKGFLWTATEQWNWDWEVKYAAWVRENVNPEFFAKYDLPADCADAAYAFRWIFARINGLPAANHLASGRLLTHETYKSSWARLPQHELWHKDRRFLAAVDYLLNYTYTHTLMQDSYPVKIDNQTFLEGIHHLQIHSSTGHTMIVNQSNLNTTTQIPLQLIWATVPRDLANLSEGGFWRQDQAVDGVHGFMRIRQVVKTSNGWRLVNKENNPHYSLEQFSPEFMGEKSNFALVVVEKIAPGFDPLVVYKNGRDLFIEGILQREKVVQEGFEFCQQNDCSPGSANYENWSTPSRDKRIGENLASLETFVRSVITLSTEPLKAWAASLQSDTLEVAGKEVSLNFLRTLWLAKFYGSDPRLDVSERWIFNSSELMPILEERLTELVEEREQKIASNSCSPQKPCDPESAKWQENSTRKLDERIQLLHTQALYFCKNSPAGQCTSLMQMMKQNQLRSESQWNFLKRSHHFSYDPNDSNTERWGKDFNPAKVRVFTQAQYFQSNQQGDLALSGPKVSKIIKADGSIEIFPNHLQMLHHSFTTDSSFVANQQTGTYQIKSGQNFLETNLSLNKSFKIMNDNLIRVSDQIYAFQNNQWQVIHQEAGEINNIHQSEIFIHRAPDGKENFIFWEKDLLNIVPITLGLNSPQFYRVIDNSENSMIFQIEANEGTIVTLWHLNKTTGAFSEWQQTYGYLENVINPKIWLLQTMTGQQQVWQWNDDFSSSSVILEPLWATSYPGLNKIVANNKGIAEILTFENSQLTNTVATDSFFSMLEIRSPFISTQWEFSPEQNVSTLIVDNMNGKVMGQFPFVAPHIHSKEGAFISLNDDYSFSFYRRSPEGHWTKWTSALAQVASTGNSPLEPITIENRTGMMMFGFGQRSTSDKVKKGTYIPLAGGLLFQLL